MTGIWTPIRRVRAAVLGWITPTQRPDKLHNWESDAMTRLTAELKDGNGFVVATFNETCHDNGVTAATVRLRPPLAPQTLTGTELLELFVHGSSQPVLSVEASDLTGTAINEFHGRIGALAAGKKISLVRSPGGDLATQLIVLASGIIEAHLMDARAADWDA
jgi:hypothetical protein